MKKMAPPSNATVADCLEACASAYSLTRKQMLALDSDPSHGSAAYSARGLAALIMARMQGFSYREVADHLGYASKGAVFALIDKYEQLERATPEVARLVQKTAKSIGLRDPREKVSVSAAGASRSKKIERER